MSLFNSKVLATLVFAVAPIAAAQTAGSAPPPNLASIPSAVIQRTDAQRRPTGGYYPERAFRIHANGLAVINCMIGAGASLSACSVVYEYPDGYFFGAAALRLAANGGLRAPDDIARIDQGMSVEFKVPFVMFPHSDQDCLSFGECPGTNSANHPP